MRCTEQLTNWRFHMRARPTGSGLIALLVCAALAIGVGAVGAGNITGTAGADKLRGSAGPDRLNGRAGNDKLYGLAGNDVLVGGPGDDLLVGGPGADRLLCGPGRDVARGDAKDKAGKDCEVVKGIPIATSPPPPPPPPPPPAATPVTAGSYQGQTQNGNFVFLTVSANRTFTGLRVNDLPAPCEGGGTLTGGSDFGDSTFTITDAATFDESGTWDGSMVQGDIEWTHWDGKVAGRFDTATTVTGTIVMNYGLKYQGTPMRCSSGEIRWSAALRP